MSWKKFDGLTDHEDFVKLVDALSVFNEWCKLACNTDLHLTDEFCRRLCCPEMHVGAGCCATFNLIKILEKIGGFGGHLKIHVLAQHVGPFAWEHRVLGAVMEEGLEKLHRTIKDDLELISRKDETERL